VVEIYVTVPRSYAILPSLGGTRSITFLGPAVAGEPKEEVGI